MVGEQQTKMPGRERVRPVACEERSKGARLPGARVVWGRVLDLFGFAEEDEEAVGRAEEWAVPSHDAADACRRRGRRPASPRERALLTLPGAAAERAGWRMSVFRPVSLDDARPVADQLKGLRPVILNLERADRDARQRILDFLGGVLYTVDGSLHQVGPGVLLLTPANVEVAVVEAPSR